MPKSHKESVRLQKLPSFEHDKLVLKHEGRRRWNMKRHVTVQGKDGKVPSAYALRPLEPLLMVGQWGLADQPDSRDDSCLTRL